MRENVQKRENYNQVCIWEGTIVVDEKTCSKDFEDFILKEFGARIQYLEEIVTGPDIINGEPDPETGRRNDVFFAVHNDDVGKFAIRRLKIGIRWIEDVLAECNYRSPIYPKRVFDYCIWNKEYLSHWKDK